MIWGYFVTIFSQVRHQKNLTAIMPAGVGWGEYLRFTATSLFTMFLGSQFVHSIYKPLKVKNQFYFARLPNGLSGIMLYFFLNQNLLKICCRIWMNWSRLKRKTSWNLSRRVRRQNKLVPSLHSVCVVTVCLEMYVMREWINNPFDVKNKTCWVVLLHSCKLIQFSNATSFSQCYING